MTDATKHEYLIAVGSNRRNGIYACPRQVIAGAVEALHGNYHVRAVSHTIITQPVGPSQRRYANAAVRLKTNQMPDLLLDSLKRLEREFGSRRGERWSSRVLDLDIILWSGGIWPRPARATHVPQSTGNVGHKRLVIPHISFRNRSFVLEPAAQIAPGWRDPVTGRTIRQLMFLQKMGKAA
ncbi:2-amino-4-hydroxy-6-hydroxymethyldihydropteridine diphosphokinase [Sphingorhabdus sp. Alg239-R122]|uniref:2-amino-4-hydroxy-6- hydroxymethyldihydropteridine diphosphokinase n=1 Tax=Sphingorhabdus sp. Alg239-R122 TaxID=2305989 RepID=UPI0013DA9B14|nr:2-amino-4-hydroxy-6-hydroxymethyldihydropteridine diphosphokinase [Sphingorhabdus sp. Alg239-R122]